MNLLVMAHNYHQRGKRAFVIQPRVGDRNGVGIVESRIGIERKADLSLTQGQRLDATSSKWGGVDCVLVDEAQFLTPFQVDDLRRITLQAPVICYGLRTDYTSNLFPGSKRLMELADRIEEVKTVCAFCTRKTTINMKCVDGKAIKSGDAIIDVGREDKYIATCWKCWDER